MSAVDPQESPTPVTLSLATASRLSGVSQPTIRKHIAAGHLEAQKEPGKFGDTWRIEPAILAEFVQRQYGRTITLSHLTPNPVPGPPPETGSTRESAAELRRMLDEKLEELGRYKALVEASEAADRRVEDLLNARIAELQHERDVAQAEVLRLKSRGWWARTFGGRG